MPNGIKAWTKPTHARRLVFIHNACLTKRLARLASHYLMMLTCFTLLSTLHLFICVLWNVELRGNFQTLSLHHIFLACEKKNMRLLYWCSPMCKTTITAALAETAVTPRGDLQDLHSLRIQFATGWNGVFTRASENLHGAHIHLPIWPTLPLTHHTSSQRVRERSPYILVSVSHNCRALSAASRKSPLIDSVLKWYSS